MIKHSQARITHKETWEDYFLFSLESPIIASQAQPGQFIMVRTSLNSNPLLRRPFSIHSKERKNIEIFFQKSGLGTSILSQKKPNEFLDIIGPLGKGFNSELDLNRKDVALIGGGRGIAPIYFLAQKLRSQGALVRVFYGGKTFSDLPLKEKFEKAGIKLLCSTDDGSLSFKGFITDLFEIEIEKLLPAYIYACGPELMMKKLAKTALDKKIPAEFSLESVMGCGFGVCWGCVRKIVKDGEAGWHKICEEGPVFKAEEIIWQEEEK